MPTINLKFSLLIILSIFIIASQSFQWPGIRSGLLVRSLNNRQMASSLDPTSRSLIRMRMDDDIDDEEEEAAAPMTTLAPDISPLKEGLRYSESLNGSDVRVGIIMARWNADIIEGLYKGVNESLAEAGVKQSNIFVTYVPGAFELPITARFLAMSKRVDVIVCLGCLIKGDTMHFEYIADATAHGIMQVSLDSLVPCLFGVLTVLNKQQAIDRSAGASNEGLSWGKSAVEMGLNRMSALGMGKPLGKSASEASSTAFVAFKNGTLPLAPTNSPDEANKKPPSKRVFF